jgi:hypothetical protein
MRRETCKRDLDREFPSGVFASARRNTALPIVHSEQNRLAKTSGETRLQLSFSQIITTLVVTLPPMLNVRKRSTP